ncbi:MAG: sugar ABC transporter ATP-binding protein [Arachnia sp.]
MGEWSPDAQHQGVLRVSGISKSFAGVHALTDVSLEIKAGLITALLGENGAGKSTLIRISSGEMQPDRGRIELDGAAVRLGSPVEGMRRGIFVVHQEPQLVNEMTVAENLFIDDLGERSMFALRRPGRLVARAKELLERLDMTELLPDPGRLCRHISAAQRQMVDIVRALSRDPRVLFLDEPNSSLSRQETNVLFSAVRRLAAQGAAIALVSHRFSEVYELADEIVILRDGMRVAAGSPQEIPAEDAIRHMAGDKRREKLPSIVTGEDAVAADEPGPVMLRLSRCTGPGFTDVDFEVRAGEIVGMAELVGAGRTEIALATIGANQLDAGTVMVNGREGWLRSPAQAVDAGIGYISEERRTGVFYTQDIVFNMSTSVLSDFSVLGILRRGAQVASMTDLAGRLGVRAPSVATAIKALSGGNQQKVLLARALASEPKVLILDEPTRGVDVGTKREIYAILRDLARVRGLAVWFISSDLEEVLELSDRVVIVKDGRITGSFAGGPEAGAVVAAALGEEFEPTVETVAHEVWEQS